MHLIRFAWSLEHNTFLGSDRVIVPNQTKGVTLALVLRVPTPGLDLASVA